MLTASNLSALAPTDSQSGVRHGFLTRQGGVSTGIYGSLNCGPGSDDAPDHVADNRQRAVERLRLGPNAPLLSLHQIHSAKVCRVEKPWTGAAPQADALVTRTHGMAIGILTADCTPVLFADATAKVIGAAHAGWRGALGGVLEATVAAMVDMGAQAERIQAAIGPTIAQASYEVGSEFCTRFTDADPQNQRFFIPSDRADHHRFDLPGYVLARLSVLGLGGVVDLGIDTYHDAARFFSYRRTTHQNEADYGRQISLIGLD